MKKFVISMAAAAAMTLTACNSAPAEEATEAAADATEAAGEATEAAAEATTDAAEATAD